MNLKDICALIAATSLGAGGTVAVQKATKPKPVKVRAAKASEPAPRPPALPAPSLYDCPTPSLDFMPMGSIAESGSDLASQAPIHTGHYNDWLPYRATVGAAPAPGVPEPGTWAMMIGGFGLVGLGMRRKAVQDGR